jgi:hypothetical protein
MSVGLPKLATGGRAACPRVWLARSLALALALLAAGCTTVEPAQIRPNGTHTGARGAGPTAGQTFSAHNDGLAGIEVLVTDLGAPRSGPLVLHLRASAGPGIDLRRATIPMETAERDRYLRFDFEPLADSAGQSYYFELSAPEAPSAAALAAWRGDAGTYPSGSLYLDGRPADGQLAFQLVYANDRMLAGWAGSVVRDLPLALAITALFVLPGLALVLWLGRSAGSEALDARSALLLAPGASAALFPVILLTARPLGIPLGPWAAWGVTALGGLAVAVALRRHPPRSWPRPAWPAWDDVALAVVIGLTVLVRFSAVRSVAVPLGPDSIEHSVIVQLIQDDGGLPSDWEPYAPFTSFTSQFGFHANVAFLQWLAGLPTLRAVLIGGQVLNALAALTLYPLARRIAGSRWAGVFALLVAGLLTPMPMYYVNWGRDAQLVGQVILPVALWTFIAVVSPSRRSIGMIVLAGLTAAGMMLGSYRGLHFYGVFALAWILVAGALGVRWARGQALQPASALLILLVAEIWLLPWQLGLTLGEWPTLLETTITGTPRLEAVLAEYAFWSGLESGVPGWLVALAVVGLLWALVRRRWEVLVVGLWVAGLALIPALRLIKFPTAAFFQTFSLMIALYIPAALLVGWLASELIRLVELDQPRAAAPLALLAVLAGCAWGLPQRASAVEPTAALVTPPDLRAMAWIRVNVPADALFVVNSRIYHQTSAIGTDAGWWLPLLAGRQNLMPPQYAFTSEAERTPGYRRSILDLLRTLRADPAPSRAALDALCRVGATHVYVGQQQNMAGSEEGRMSFDPAALAASPYFEVLYQQDRVWVLALASQACAP